MGSYKEIDISKNKGISVNITCSECGHNFSSSIDVEFKFNDISYGSGKVHCHECEKGYKYETQTNNNTLKLRFPNNEIDFNLHHSKDFCFDENEVPPYCYKNAFKFYNKQIERLREINRVKFNSDILTQTNNRLVFSGIITSFETYIKEVFYYLVFITGDGLRVFVEKNENYQREKIKISELFKEYDSIQNRVFCDVEKILFHNLDKIINLFNMFNIDISDFKYKREIIKAIQLRHDFVHRSGVDEDNSLIVINKDEVNKTMELFDKYVRHINKNTNSVLNSIDYLLDDISF